jgi:hypothetical protein
MNFIKKIVDGRVDELTHMQFQKFSRGEFSNRALVKIKNSSGKYTLATTSEFANDLVLYMAKKLGEKTAEVKGSIIYTGNLEEINYKNKKQFMGVKQYVIEESMPGIGIIDLMSKFPKAFFALSFKVGEDELKIKPEAPKSAKPSTKTEEKPNPNFCKLTTKDKKVIESFVFEKPDFKQVNISHTFLIKDIIIPNELKDEKDFLKVREFAKRKGVILREVEIDGQKFRKEIDFEA